MRSWFDSEGGQPWKLLSSTGLWFLKEPRKLQGNLVRSPSTHSSSYGGNNSVLGTLFHFFKLFHVVGVVLTLIGEEVNLLQDETFPRAKCEEEFSMEQ